MAKFGPGALVYQAPALTPHTPLIPFMTLISLGNDLIYLFVSLSTSFFLHCLVCSTTEQSLALNVSASNKWINECLAGSRCLVNMCWMNYCLDYSRRKAKLLSCVWLFVTPWTVAYQVPPPMGFSRHKYWSGLPFPSPGDHPDPGIEPGPPALQAGTLPSEPSGTIIGAP